MNELRKETPKQLYGVSDQTKNYIDMQIKVCDEQYSYIVEALNKLNSRIEVIELFINK